MKVLFATDGSKISYNSILNFSNWAGNFNADILSVSDYGMLPITLDNDKYASYCSSTIQSILKNSKVFFDNNNIKFDNTITKCGSVIDSILESEREKDYDILVLGSNGKKGIKKWLGSVSQEIASLSENSVYIAKNLNNSERILFAFDLTAERIINRALSFLNLKGKEIHIVSVYEMPDYLFLQGEVDMNWIQDAEVQQYNSAKILLDRIEKIFEDRGCKIYSKHILKGIPSEEIIKYSSEKNIDLVVTGMHDKKHLSRFFNNSVSKRILEHTNSDVLIIKD
ncbi:universal stress protein [bacterium]|nr:universal stress protein [bacterium]